MIYRLAAPEAESVEELRVLEWHKAVGNLVESEDLVVELESDKAVIEVRSPRTCYLRKTTVVGGDWARVGSTLAWFSDAIDEPLETEQAVDLGPTFQVT